MMRKELGNDSQLWEWHAGNTFVNKQGYAIDVKGECSEPGKFDSDKSGGEAISLIKSLPGIELCGWEHHGGPNQQFRLEGQHLVCNLHGRELVLDIEGGCKEPGTRVILWTNEGCQKNQMWKLDYESDSSSSSSSDSE